MKTNEKVEAIKYLKEIVVKYQKYEFAAWLRHKEGNILDELRETYSYLPDNPISYGQYLYLTELFSEFENDYLLQIRKLNMDNSYMLNRETRLKDDTSEMRDCLYKICLPVIRAEKLDKLLGDES